MPEAFPITPGRGMPWDTSIMSAGRAGGCQWEREVMDSSALPVATCEYVENR